MFQGVTPGQRCCRCVGHRMNAREVSRVERFRCVGRKVSPYPVSCRCWPCYAACAQRSRPPERLNQFRQRRTAGARRHPNHPLSYPAAAYRAAAEIGFYHPEQMVTPLQLGQPSSGLQDDGAIRPRRRFLLNCHASGATLMPPLRSRHSTLHAWE